MSNKLLEYELEEQRREELKHRDVLLALADVLKTNSGQVFIEYLFESFGVGESCPMGMKGEDLHDYLGLQRAGHSIFELASQADYKLTSEILAKLMREKYERRIEQQRIEQSE